MNFAYDVQFQPAAKYCEKMYKLSDKKTPQNFVRSFTLILKKLHLYQLMFKK